MISQYNPKTGTYSPTAQPTNQLAVQQPKVATGQPAAVAPMAPTQGQWTLPNYGQPSNQIGALYSNWQDPYKQILASMQAKGGGGGGGGVAKVQKIELPAFDQQYTDYRDTMYKNMQDLMANPAGYSPDELAMVQGQALDKLYSSVAGAKMGAISDANRLGYLNTGRVDTALQDINRNALAGSADALRQIALQDLENKRQGKYKANELGQAWASQMGGEQQWLTGEKVGLEKDYQNRLDAARRAAAAAGARKASDILNMQLKIADMGIKQQQYDDALAMQMLQQQAGFGQGYADMERAAYESNPNYTGQRNVWG